MPQNHHHREEEGSTEAWKGLFREDGRRRRRETELATLLFLCKYYSGVPSTCEKSFPLPFQEPSQFFVTDGITLAAVVGNSAKRIKRKKRNGEQAIDEKSSGDAIELHWSVHLIWLIVLFVFSYILEEWATIEKKQFFISFTLLTFDLQLYVAAFLFYFLFPFLCLRNHKQAIKKVWSERREVQREPKSIICLYYLRCRSEEGDEEEGWDWIAVGDRAILVLFSSERITIFLFHFLFPSSSSSHWFPFLVLLYRNPKWTFGQRDATTFSFPWGEGECVWIEAFNWTKKAIETRKGKERKEE